jgi:hypothetical protein
MDANLPTSSHLKAGEGMGDFMRFTSDAPPVHEGPAPTPEGFTRWPVDEPAVRRLSRIGVFRRVAGHGTLRLL